MRLRSLVLTVLALVMTHTGSAQLYPELHAYENCSFPDGLQTVDVSGLGPGVHSRTVQTVHGGLPLDLVAGRRVMFAYPNTDFFANVKVELLPAISYANQKRVALEGFDYLLADSADSSRNNSLHSPLDGFEIRGFDRNSLSGGVLGLYVMFDDTKHLLTTIYLLNQEPAQRKFQTMEEYRQLRDSFLTHYTECIRRAEGAAASGEK